MAGTWTEIMGTRKTEETTQYIDHIITCELAVADDPALPAQGAIYVDIVIAGQAGIAPSSTGLVSDPATIQTSFAKRGATKGFDRMVCRLRGYKVEAAI